MRRWSSALVAVALLLLSATHLAVAQEPIDPATVSNTAIARLEVRIADAEAELARVAAAETDAQGAAVAARSALEEADRRVVEAAEAAESAASALRVADDNLANVEGVLRDATAALATIRDQLAATEAALDETRHLLQLRVRETWKGGGELNTATMVLRIEEFNDAVHLQQMIRAVVADGNQLVADYLRLQATRQEQVEAADAEEQRVEAARDRTAEVRAERSDALATSRRAEQDARDEQAARDATLVEVEADLANLGADRLAVEERLDGLRAELAAERRAEVERLRAEEERRRAAAAASEQARQQADAERRAAEARAAEQRRAVASAPTTTAADEPPASDDGPSPAEPPPPSSSKRPPPKPPPPPPSGGSGCGSTSSWAWPTAGCVNSPFGYRHHPILDTRRLHAGFDIAAPAGQPIVAVADGVVYRADYSSGGHGNVVVIDHGAVATLYAHQQRLMVSAGDRVVAGQQIGTIGSTGLSTGPHLHLQVHLDGPGGQVVDPMPWFR